MPLPAGLGARDAMAIGIERAILLEAQGGEWDPVSTAAVIAETNAAGMKDMGKVIAALKAKYAGQMDFGKASGMVKAALTG